MSIPASYAAGLPLDSVREVNAILGPSRRLGRIARGLREAADAHDASLLGVSRRALALSREGGALDEADHAGLLDPRLPPEYLARYTSVAEAFALQDRINPRGMVNLAHDKVLFAEWLTQRGLPVPATIAVFDRSGPGWTADGSLLPEAADWIRLLSGLQRDLVLKPIRGHLGYEVRVLRPDGGGFRSGGGPVISPAEIVATMAASRFDGFVLQERLRPHREIVALTGSEALQTLRITTLADADGRPWAVAPFLRIASGSSDIDNFRGGTSGNLVAPLHLEDGRLFRGLGAEPGGRGLREIVHHPDTGREIEGFEVPGWNAALDLALRAARESLPLHTVGWDIAPTENGPVIVEANPQWNPAWAHPHWPQALEQLRGLAAPTRPAVSPGRRSRWSIR